MYDRSRLPDKIYNIHYKQDIHYAMQLCRWILKPIGIWHLTYDRSSRRDKLLSFVLIFVCFSGLCFVLVPAGPYILFREKDVNIKVKLFGPVGFCLTAAIKYCFLGARVSAIGRCVKHLESDWRAVQHQDHRRMMLRNSLVGRRLTTLCVIFLYTGGMSYHAIMPLSSRTRTNGSFTSRPLVYPGYDLYVDSQASPAYETIFCMHCLSAIIQYSCTTAACSLAASFATHACGQVQILMTLLDDLVDGERTKGTVEKRLSLIVRHHVRVLRFTADVEEVLREICLMELVAATLIICLLEYYCMMEWANSDAVAILTYFILLISLTFNILIFCYIGELLVEEYSKIGSAAYEINWYDLPGHRAVDLVMIITMSHYPPKLTAGKFVELSLNTFSAVSFINNYCYCSISTLVPLFYSFLVI
ncbi:odorant receptor 4 isoform X1 [Monomorium pharaonis]|uniref:odorant receptor 4 isoform X1 n=1 Tax=Monomorium pharaonis TaxID=307658 RepID=UPI00063FCA5C|nr:odorant receptor 4 isoform X1 [Monomorium pharaonis]